MPAKVWVGFTRLPHQCGFRIELRHMELKLGPRRPATVSNKCPSNCPGNLQFLSFPTILCFIGAKVATILLLPSAGMMPATWCWPVQTQVGHATQAIAFPSWPAMPGYAQLIVNAKACTSDCFRGLPERGAMVRSGWASTTVISNLCATMMSHA